MTIKLTVKQRLFGQLVVNTYHYVSDQGSSGMTPDEMAQAVVNAYGTWLPGLWSPEWSVIGVDWVDPDAGGGQPALPANVTGLPIVGTQGTQSQASQIAVLINWNSVENAPWRGRTFLAGMYDAGVTVGGVWESGIVSAANALATDLLGISNGSGGFASLVLRSGGTEDKETGEVLVPAGTTSLVQSGVCNPIPSTQRRRRIGVGA